MKNAALIPFGTLIGNWRTTATHPLVPGKTFHGRTTVESIEGGAFLKFTMSTDEPEIPDGVAIIGSDDEGPEFWMLYFDERGVSRRYHTRVDDNVWTWWRNTPSFSQKMVCTIGEDGRTMSARGTMSRDGGAWEGDLEVEYERIDR